MPPSPRLKPPVEPEPSECCGSGCARCVWDVYYDKLADYEEAKARGEGEGAGAEAEADGSCDDDDGFDDDEDDDLPIEEDTAAHISAAVPRPFAALLTQQLPAPKATGSIVVRYNDDVRGLTAAEGMLLLLQQTGGNISHSGGNVPPNTAFVDYLLPRAEQRKRERAAAAVVGGGGVGGRSASAASVEAKLSADAMAAVDSLQREVMTMRRLPTAAAGGGGGSAAVATEWRQVTSVEPLMDLSSALGSGGGGSADPLVGLRLTLNSGVANSNAGNNSVGSEHDIVGVAAVANAQPLLPGDVVEVLVPNDAALCEAILKRLRLPDAARRVTLTPSPFAAPNSFPAWLSPSGVAAKVASDETERRRQQQQQQKGTATPPPAYNNTYASASAKVAPPPAFLAVADAIEGGIDGLLQAQQAAEGRTLDAIESARDEQKLRQRQKQKNISDHSPAAEKSSQQEVGVAEDAQSSAVLPPSVDLGTASARSLLSIFMHYVDVSSSAYLRPPFFAALCRVAEAVALPPLPSTEQEMLSLLESLRGGGNGADGGSAAPKPIPDALLLRFLAVGAAPSAVAAAIASTRPTMLDILTAFPTATPQLPRLLEVCAPLRPRVFSVAGSEAPTTKTASEKGAARGAQEETVDLFLRAFGCGATASHQKTSDPAATPTVASFATASSSFRTAVEALFREKYLQPPAAVAEPNSDSPAAEVAAASAVTPAVPSSSGGGVKYSVSAAPFVGHVSGRLVRMAAAASKTKEATGQSGDTPSNPSAPFPPSPLEGGTTSDRVWARLQRVREEQQPAAASAKTSSSSNNGLFPAIPRDTPLILVSAGSGFAPLRAALRERLSSATNTTSPPLTSPAGSGKFSTTVVLCAVRSLAEAATIDGLIDADVRAALSRGAAATEVGADEALRCAKRQRCDTQWHMQGPSLTESVPQQRCGAVGGGVWPCPLRDVEDSAAVQPAEPQLGGPEMMIVQRHFFVSSSSFSSVNAAATGSVFSPSALPSLVGGAGSAYRFCSGSSVSSSSFIHSGRLVDWTSSVGATTPSSSFAHASASSPLPTIVTKRVPLRAPLCRFPSAMAATMLFAAVAGDSGFSSAQRGAALSFDRTVRAVARRTIGGQGNTAPCGRPCEGCHRRGECASSSIVSAFPPQPNADENDSAASSVFSFSAEAGSSADLPDTKGARVYACGPRPFLASVYKGLQHLIEWGPAIGPEHHCHTDVQSKIGGEDGGDVSPLPSVPPPPMPAQPMNDESESEYEMRKLFFGKQIVFDYWQD